MLKLICKNLRRRRSQLAIQAVELVADLLLTKKKFASSCFEAVPSYGDSTCNSFCAPKTKYVWAHVTAFVNGDIQNCEKIIKICRC